MGAVASPGKGHEPVAGLQAIMDLVAADMASVNEIILDKAVSDVDLIPKLAAIAAERNNNKVFLRADGGVPYERVAQVMGALNAGGFNSIGLVTDTGGPTFGGGN